MSLVVVLLDDEELALLKAAAAVVDRNLVDTAKRLLLGGIAAVEGRAGPEFYDALHKIRRDDGLSGNGRGGQRDAGKTFRESA